MRKLLITTLILMASSAYSARAAVPADHSSTVSQKIKAELAKKFPNARIETIGAPRITRGSIDAAVSKVTILEETAKGDVHFLVHSADGAATAEGWTSFSALVPAQVAVRRIQPGERLNKDLFVEQSVNVATGIGREYRGVILSSETKFDTLETRQTILEGQFATATAVQRVPDVRKGDSLQVRLVSGGLSLSTQGTADEPGQHDQQIRVITQKSKRALVGKLGTDGIVEVRL